MAIFNSYVSLPEGSLTWQWNIRFPRTDILVQIWLMSYCWTAGYPYFQCLPSARIADICWLNGFISIVQHHSITARLIDQRVSCWWPQWVVSPTWLVLPSSFAGSMWVCLRMGAPPNPLVHPHHPHHPHHPPHPHPILTLIPSSSYPHPILTLLTLITLLTLLTCE